MSVETLQMMAVIVSIAVAGLSTALGAVGGAFGESRIGAAAMDALARQTDEAPAITRNLFVSLAMVESTAIFCLVIGLILLFANPYVTVLGR
jgi:F-type H+-transporting ATPase subunit c